MCIHYTPALSHTVQSCSLIFFPVISLILHLSPTPQPPPSPVYTGVLLPLPGESVESSALELGATSKTVGSSMAQLLTAANQGTNTKDGEYYTHHYSGLGCFLRDTIYKEGYLIWKDSNVERF